MPPFSSADITRAARSHVDEATYGAQGETTRCNAFVRDVVESLVARPRPELAGQADDQFNQLATSAIWVRQNFANDPAGVLQRSFDGANLGELVIVAYKGPARAHGHIAVVVPAPLMELSGVWNMPMPFIAQAGKMNPRGLPGETNSSVFASLKLSYGFAPPIAPSMEVFFYRR